MQFEAFFWNSSGDRPTFEEFSHDPDFRLLDGWGRFGDMAVIAEIEGMSLGAAWCRLWTDEHHWYGFVDSETPELGIAVERTHRSAGIGRLLLRALVKRLRDGGVQKLSLSVDPANFALRLYESEGFEKVAESGTSWTMIKILKD